jgi:hypothetical protein
VLQDCSPRANNSIKISDQVKFERKIIKIKMILSFLLNTLMILEKKSGRKDNMWRKIHKLGCGHL